MAEGSGEDENPYSFHSYSRKNQQEYGEENGDTEDNSSKTYQSLGTAQTAEKKSVIENYGSGKYFGDCGTRC